jgi:hypothetical protein
MSTTTNEDLCPATGRECHNAICETGGCRKARTKPASKPVTGQSPVAAAPSSDAQVKRLEKQIAAAAKVQAEASAIFADTLDVLDHADAALSNVQQSLGVKTSPRLEQLRSVASQMRAFLTVHPVPKPARGSDRSAGTVRRA